MLELEQHLNLHHHHCQSTRQQISTKSEALWPSSTIHYPAGTWLSHIPPALAYSSVQLEYDPRLRNFLEDSARCWVGSSWKLHVYCLIFLPIGCPGTCPLSYMGTTEGCAPTHTKLDYYPAHPFAIPSYTINNPRINKFETLFPHAPSVVSGKQSVFPAGSMLSNPDFIQISI